MIQACRRLSLTAKSCLECRIDGQIGPQQLDCDGPAEPLVNSKADLSHAPAAQQFAQLIPAPDRRWAASHFHGPPSTPAAILGHGTPEREIGISSGLIDAQQL